MTKNSRHA